MTEAFNRMTFSLLEATVSLYLQNAAGGAGARLAADLKAENLRVGEKWIVVATRPSGARHPVNHPLVPEYTLTLGRLLAYELADALGFQTSGQTYVLDVVWNDESGLGWHRATFYGVTIASREQEARDVEAGVMDNLEFNAQYFVPAAGVNLAVPATPPALPPLTVRYLADGVNVLLYAFAAATGWTALADPAGRATIAEDGGHNFAVTFDGHAAPALSLAAGDGVLRLALLNVGGQPLPADLPRLDFYAGAQKLGSVTERGMLFCAQLAQVAAPETDSGFILGGGGAAWRMDGLQVAALEEIFPTDYPLQSWQRLESLAVLAAGQRVAFWADDTANGHGLAASGAPGLDFTDGGRAVRLGGGDYFHCADAAFDTSAQHLFVVARRAAGAAGVPLAACGTAGYGRAQWFAGKQSARLQSDTPVFVTGALADGNAWCLYELQKGATGCALRLNGQLDGLTAWAPHSAFGSVQDYFLGGDGGTGATGGFIGWLRTALVYRRELTAGEADRIRMWLRATYNLL